MNIWSVFSGILGHSQNRTQAAAYRSQIPNMVANGEINEQEAGVLDTFYATATALANLAEEMLRDTIKNEITLARRYNELTAAAVGTA